MLCIFSNKFINLYIFSNFFRDLLWTLTEAELHTLEKMLCSQEEPKIDEKSSISEEIPLKIPEDSITQIYKKQLNCKQFIHDFYAYNFGTIVPENGILENSEDCLVSNKCQIDVRKSEKCANNNIEFDVEFQRDSGNKRKSSDVPESDIETLVSGEFCVPECIDNDHNRCQLFTDQDVGLLHQERQQKDCEHALNDDSLRTSVNNVHPLSNSVGLCECQHLSNERTENCTFCSSENIALEHASSYESHLRQLHTGCTCGINSSSRDHLTPSREIMRQVMRRVEIVPPGQRIVGFSSSVESSPRAYHHGLLSHSFPTRPGRAQHNYRPESSIRRRLKKQSRHQRSRHLQSESEASPSHCYNANNQNTHSGDPCWNSNPVYSSPLMIPRVQHLRLEDDLTSNSETTYSSCSSCQSISSVSSPEWDSTR